MASDEQRSPWLPVQPEGQHFEDVPTPADAMHEAHEVTVQPTALPAALPSFDDILAPTSPPESGAPTSDRPFGLTPSRPSLLRPSAAPFADFAAADAPPAPPAAPATPVLSPYLAVERPAAPYAQPSESAQPVADVFASAEPAVTPAAAPAPVGYPSSGEYPSSVEYARPVESTPLPEYAAQVESNPPLDYAQPAADAFAPADPPSAPALAEYAPPIEYTPPAEFAPAAAGNPFLPAPAPIAPPMPEPMPEPMPASAAPVAPAPVAAAPIPFAPWTGVVPAAPAAPVSATPLSATPTGATPTGATPTGATPVVDPPAPQWQDPQAPVLVGGLVPTPIEAEEGDIFAPILPPDAAEIQPRFADPFDPFTAGTPVQAPAPLAPQARAPQQLAPEQFGQEYVPEATDAVRQLGAAAVSNASLEAAGAPTPRSGIPLVGPDGTGMPAFGEEDPFVPRFEPIGGVVSAPVPTVSFTTPAPPVRPLSPLSDLKLPESDEPAYIPQVEYAQQLPHADAPVAGSQDVAAFAPPASFTPTAAPTTETVPPARPWSPVDPQDVEFAGGTPFAAHSSPTAPEPVAPVERFAAEPASESLAPPAAPWDRIMGGTEPSSPAPEPVSWPSDEPDLEAPVAPFAPVAPEAPVAPAAELAAATDAAAHQVPPVTPVASFFAAAAGRSPHRTEDAVDASVEPAAPEAFAPPQPHDEPESTHELPSGILDEEPVHTTATPYTQSQGEWSPPALSAAEAVTQVTGFAPVNASPTLPATQEMPQGALHTSEIEQGDALAAKTETGDNVPLDQEPKKRGRGRLVLWIVLAAVVAAGATVLIYRMYFLPDPIILPAPTVTAPAATPTAKPAAITDDSDFVKAMPTTVGTYVLIDYKVTDPVGDASLPARAAEHVTLTYGPGSGAKDFTVEAYQHYNVDDAKTAYDAYAAGATDVKDVTVGGTVVGTRAFSTKGSVGTVVWRNDTVVFDVNGPADKVLGFFEHFGL